MGKREGVLLLLSRGVMSIIQVSTVLFMQLQTLKEVLTLCTALTSALRRRDAVIWEKVLQLLAYLDVCEVLQQLCRLLMLSTHLHNLCKQSTLVILGFGDQDFCAASSTGQPIAAAGPWVL